MTKDSLQKLEKLYQLCLTEEEKEGVIAFFAKQDDEFAALENIDTANVERMVHVMPILTVVREDVEKKLFTREELQRNAPETMDGYWQVPRLVE
ncbi:MAG: Asp-tRNA(Asn)/Glu-tRNA(Gln) amidotransferase subunit GatC [Oscillospiraceae bacterium]|nr:Asp-tRNA(Asn)/Glu-tRNA(Gln) amidotransferase subunit GatC [Oscillospiraceae bacterium]